MNSNNSASSSSSSAPVDEKLAATTELEPPKQRNSIAFTGGIQIPMELYDSESDDDLNDDSALDDGKRAYQGGFAAAAYEAARADHLKMLAKQKADEANKGKSSGETKSK